jgi:hypothetical protein
MRTYPICATMMITAVLQTGCAEHYSSSAYATVAPQSVTTRDGRFEIFDRREISRLSISPKSDCVQQALNGGMFEPLKAGVMAGYCGTQLSRLGKSLQGLFPFEFMQSSVVASPASRYVEPLMEYFGQTGRSCSLVRGHPLIEQQWEFVYNCTPGFNPSAVTWGGAGFSNALPPPY